MYGTAHSNAPSAVQYDMLHVSMSPKTRGTDTSHSQRNLFRYTKGDAHLKYVSRKVRLTRHTHATASARDCRAKFRPITLLTV